mmetsp:Transcript_77394/g.203136  ORF Transcript_77394/g.203136 Transcript_77394/m.203136 type:complete len:470 (-) Transcript_77394:1-1410(-)
MPSDASAPPMWRAEASGLLMASYIPGPRASRCGRGRRPGSARRGPKERPSGPSEAELARQAVLDEGVEQAGTTPVDALLLVRRRKLRLLGLTVGVLRRGGRHGHRVGQERHSALLGQALDPDLLEAGVVRDKALQPRGDELRGGLLEVVDLLPLEEVESDEGDLLAGLKEALDRDHAGGGDLPDAGAELLAQVQDEVLLDEPGVHLGAREVAVNVLGVLQVRHEQVDRVGERGVEQGADRLDDLRRGEVPAVAEVGGHPGARELRLVDRVLVEADHLVEAVDHAAERQSLHQRGSVSDDQRRVLGALLRREGGLLGVLLRLDVVLEPDHVHEGVDPGRHGRVLEERKQRLEEDAPARRARQHGDGECVKQHHAGKRRGEVGEGLGRERPREDDVSHHHHRDSHPHPHEPVPDERGLHHWQEHGVAIAQEGNPHEGDEGEDVPSARGAHQEPCRDLQTQQRDVVAGAGEP